MSYYTQDLNLISSYISKLYSLIGSRTATKLKIPETNWLALFCSNSLRVRRALNSEIRSIGISLSHWNLLQQVRRERNKLMHPQSSIESLRTCVQDRWRNHAAYEALCALVRIIEQDQINPAAGFAALTRRALKRRDRIILPTHSSDWRRRDSDSVPPPLGERARAMSAATPRLCGAEGCTQAPRDEPLAAAAAAAVDQAGAPRTARPPAGQISTPEPTSAFGRPRPLTRSMSCSSFFAYRPSPVEVPARESFASRVLNS